MKRNLLYTLVALLLLPCDAFSNKQTDSLYKVAGKNFEEGNYDVMLEKVMEVMRIMEQSGTCAEKAMVTMKLGRCYYMLQQREMAMKYMKAADSFGATCNIDSMQWMCARQIGAIYYELGKSDSGLAYLHKAERMLADLPRWIERSNLYAIIGEVYHRGKKDKVKGKYYYDKSLEFAIRAEDAGSMAFAWMKQGIYSMEENDCNSGVKYFEKALGYYKQTHLVEGIMYAMNSKGWALSECGKAKESFAVMTDMRYIRDSIFKKETAENAAKYREQYETEKKEKENAKLELRVAEEVRTKRMQAGLFIIALLGLVIVALFIWSRYKLKKQRELDRYLAHQQELRFEAVIDAEENERKRIAGDLHDGVGQMMSAAKINLAVLQGDMPFTNEQQKDAYDKIVALVDESCREVRAVSHNMMPNVLLKSGLGTAIKTFISQIDNRVLRVNFYADGLNEKIDAKTEVVLYRVIQECVNNVIKHSGAGHLDISLIKDADGISVTIEDNGRGFDTSDTDKFDGIGLKNIISRVNYLNGMVEWNSTPGKGTVVVIHVPISE